VSSGRERAANKINSSFKKNLGRLDLIMLGVGCIIGSGVFVLSGVAASTIAGPAVILSFIVSGMLCIIIAFILAELSTITHEAGGFYSYAYIGLGEMFAWFCGWNSILRYTLAASIVAIGWSDYITGLLQSFHIYLPFLLIHGYQAGGVINLPAVLISIIITCLLYRGNNAGMKFNNVLVFIKLSILTLFIILAILHIDLNTWQDFKPFGYS